MRKNNVFFYVLKDMMHALKRCENYLCKKETLRMGRFLKKLFVKMELITTEL